MLQEHDELVTKRKRTRELFHVLQQAAQVSKKEKKNCKNENKEENENIEAFRLTQRFNILTGINHMSESN